MANVRIYGKTVNTWKEVQTVVWRGMEREREIISQYEIAYREYNEDGELVATGTEDFSRQRYDDLEFRWVYTWDGQRRNKGGHRWFDEAGSIKYLKSQSKEVKRYLSKKYPHAELIQLRK